MSKENIVDFLEKNKGRWFSTTEISKGTKLSRGSVIKCVKALRKGNYVLFKEDYDGGHIRILYCFREDSE